MSTYIFYVLSPEYSFKEGFQINKTLFAVLVILYPLVDLLRVFFLRIKDGKSPFEADQNHIHHYVNNKFKKSFLSLIFLETIIIVLVLLAIKVINS